MDVVTLAAQIKAANVNLSTTKCVTIAQRFIDDLLALGLVTEDTEPSECAVIPSYDVEDTAQDDQVLD